MQITLILCAVIALIFFGVQLLSLWTISRPPNHPEQPFFTLPKVSLLLAARNEEGLIIRSLEAINHLNYPTDKIEVLIGNDQSTDNTKTLVEGFIKGKPQFKLFDITKNMGKGRGKANVLAHLAHHATGEVFFITDVDVKLPENWITELLEQFTPEVGIVSGTSTCEPDKSLFSILQSIDWLHFMGYIQSFANINVGCTSVGNNMAVRATTYWETGGYENIDFSITEDYKLFKEVTERNWQWRTILTPNSLGLAWHITSPIQMLHQRKRWLIGARELPFNWKFLLVLYGLFVPALLFLFTVHPLWALCLWIAKFSIQSIYIRLLCSKVGIPGYSASQLFLYEFYVLSNTLATFLFYILPVKSIWKGRVYKTNDLR